MPGNLNNENIAKLKANELNADDTLTIVFSGDSQRFYDRLDDLVAKVNSMSNVDLLVLSGDITDFSLLQEYLWIYERLKKLNVPYVCAIGNHDLATNNGEVYTRMFGVKNYSFKYKGYKFLVHDTNSREYGFDGNVPNMWWLDSELKDTTAEWFIGLSHVPPYDADFDKGLEQSYKNLLSSNPGFILSLHGHLHIITDSCFYNDQVRYMTSNSVNKEEFILLKIVKGVVYKQAIKY